MKTQFSFSVAALLMLAADGSVLAQGTAFTYQGRLDAGGQPANGSYDIRFTLYTTSAGGTAVAGPVTNLATGVSNGLFTASVDFGPGVFTGGTSWLELGVKTNGAVGFNTLAPRQPLTPTPYAVYAESGGSATALVSGVAMGAGSGNAISTNGVQDAFIGGGVGNTIRSNSSQSFIGGGEFNIAAGQFAMVGAGQNNTASGLGAAVAGGVQNTAGGDYAFVGGGSGNTAKRFDVVGGGQGNIVGADYSGIFSGQGNFIGEALSPGLWSFIGGGQNNSIADGAPNSVIGGGQWNSIASLFSINFATGAGCTISGGEFNAIGGGDDSTIAGGYGNQIGTNVDEVTIGGGDANSIQDNAGHSVIAGGSGNLISTGCEVATIAGGGFNQILNGLVGGAIVGGTSNQVSGNCSVVGGGNNNTIQDDFASIGGGATNTIQAGAYGSAIAGGWDNTILNNAPYSGISAGVGNTIYPMAAASLVGGGQNNAIQTGGVFSVVSGGFGNIIQTNHAFIGGGLGNTNGGSYAVIGGGEANGMQLGAAYSFIGGGYNNTIQSNATFAIIPGGQGNTATNYAFAAGRFAQATNTGAFVWADNQTQGFLFGSTNANEFAVRATGGVRFVTGLDGSGKPNAGAILAPGHTSWGVLSDRNAKKNFTPVNSQAVLEALARLPVERWNYNWESDDAVPHIGPMAQDFKRAFYPGRDDKSITTLEFDGVELAAIQGLNQKVDGELATLKEELKRRDAENAELKARLEALEQIIHDQKSN